MSFNVDGRGCLNKHQAPILGNYWHFARLKIRPMHWPPWNVTLITPRPSLSLFLTPTVLSATCCRWRTLLEWCEISIRLRGNYRKMDTVWYAFSIAIFDTMWCFVLSLIESKTENYFKRIVMKQLRLRCIFCSNVCVLQKLVPNFFNQ